MRLADMTGLAAAALAAMLATAALAQEPVAPVPFVGGMLTVTEDADGNRRLAFDGRELAKNYFVQFGRTAEVAGVPVALYEVGDGGNACAANTVIVWRPEGGEVEAVTAGDDCGSPPPAVTDSAIFFVPYLLPGESQPVRTWSPEGGLKIAGQLSFAPQPGTGWRELKPEGLSHILESFDNAAVYDAARKLLGPELTGVATGLSVGGGPERLPSGVFHSNGCVPHACGISDAFMAIDAKGRKLYFAQQDDGKVKAWPALAGWPRDVRDAMQAAIGGQ